MEKKEKQDFSYLKDMEVAWLTSVSETGDAGDEGTEGDSGLVGDEAGVGDEEGGEALPVSVVGFCHCV